MIYLKTFIMFIFSFGIAFSEDYNLQINIQDGDSTETYFVTSTVSDTTFSESIKSFQDSGNNPTKKLTLKNGSTVGDPDESDIVWNIDVQYGRARIVSNTTQIPNTDEATEIDLGEGEVDSLRIYLSALINEKHEIRLLFAPLSYGNSFVTDEEIFFNGVKFLAGQQTETEYQFNSYRLSYIYHFDRVGRIQYRIGFTGKIRDAYTLVRQDGRESVYDNVGFVPLFHLGVNILLTERLNLDVELEGSWAPQGYALDIRSVLNYRITNNLQIGVGAGYLDGGAENDKVNTFAKVLFGFASLQYSF